MDLKIMWRRDFEIQENHNGTFERKKLDKPEWESFAESDIIFHSRDYAVKLFSNGTPVVIKCNEDVYLVNNEQLLDQYKKAGKKVSMLQDCLPSSESLEKVGFFG